MEDLEKMKLKISELRDQAREDAEIARNDREQHSFYLGRFMAFVECVNVIKGIVLDCTLKALEEVDHEEN